MVLLDRSEKQGLYARGRTGDNAILLYLHQLLLHFPRHLATPSCLMNMLISVRAAISPGK